MLVFGAQSGFVGIENRFPDGGDFGAVDLDELFHAFDEPVKVFVVHIIASERFFPAALQTKS